MKMSSGEALL